MKIGVIGSGIAGLISAAYLAKAGHEVHIYEQYHRVGGVLAPYEEDGYKWDLGQLLIEGMEPGQPVGDILEELGVYQKIHVKKDDRRYVFPDFAIDKPAQYAGLKWRIEYLKNLFPAETEGLDKYYKYYTRLIELLTIGYKLGKTKGIRKLGLNLVLYSKLLPLLPKKDWSAERLMNYFFSSKKLQCVFISILADFFTEPSKFLGLGVFALNPEPSFDKRMPAKISKWGQQYYFYSILGGISTLADALAETIQEHGGKIHLNSKITKIKIKDNIATGLQINEENEEKFDLIVANGGAREVFEGLVGKSHFSSQLQQELDQLTLMHGVFMIHLGLDFDPTPLTGGVCTYYYGTYDFEDGIGKAKNGEYHEGKDGFVVHVPTDHTPSMAPEGHHAMTIYTICPDTLKESTWAEKKTEFGDKLLKFAEAHIPGLTDHITKKIILTPDDFKARLNVSHFAFGGLAPEQGKTGISFEPGIDHLLYVGAQSQSGGGVNRIIIDTASFMKKYLEIR